MNQNNPDTKSVISSSTISNDHTSIFIESSMVDPAGSSKHLLEMASLPPQFYRDQQQPQGSTDHLQQQNFDNSSSAAIIGPLSQRSPSDPTIPISAALLRQQSSAISFDIPPSMFTVGRRREVLVPMGLTSTEKSDLSLNEDGENENIKILNTASEPQQSLNQRYDKVVSGLNEDPKNIQIVLPEQDAQVQTAKDLYQSNIEQDTPETRFLTVAASLGPTKGKSSTISKAESIHLRASFSNNLMPNTDNDESINFAYLDEFLSKSKGSTKEPNCNFDEFSGKLTFYSIDTASIEAKDLLELNQKSPLIDLLASRNFWLNIYLPSESDVRVFASIFNIHPLTIEDIMTPTTREKCEMSKLYYFINYRTFDQDPLSLTFMQAFNVYILVYPTFVLSFHFFPLASVSNVINRLEQLKSYLLITPYWINYALLDDITDKFFPLLNAIEGETDAIDELVLVLSVQEQADMLRRITSARKKVTNLQRLLQTKGDVIRINIKRLESLVSTQNTITNISDPTFNAMIRDICLYLGDIQDHVITMEQLLENIDNTLTRSHSNYLAQISIDITLTSNRANDAMKKLTALAALVVPINIITGLMGMNIRVPGMVGFGDDDPNLVWFKAVVGTLIGVGVIGFLIIRRMQGFKMAPDVKPFEKIDSVKGTAQDKRSIKKSKNLKFLLQR